MRKAEFREAELPRELRSLMRFDRAVFRPSDCFRAADWAGYRSFWLIVNDKKVGCCGFLEHIDDRQRTRKGLLYIVTTGILPAFQGRGFGNMLKAFEVAYARANGFTRIVTNTRQSNAAMIALNRKHHFRVIRTTPAYYDDPEEPAIVMELRVS